MPSMKQLQALRHPNAPPTLLVHSMGHLTTTNQQVHLTWQDHDKE